jgi:FkbH-like protein
MIKIIFWDLDETIWKGTLIEGSVLKNDAICEVLKEAKKRGLINVVVSKNYSADALAKLDELNLTRYFDVFYISWYPKSSSISQSLKKFNILESEAAFIDDQIFEQNEVLNSFPEIKVFSPAEILDLLSQLDINNSDDLIRQEVIKNQVLRKLDEGRSSFKEFVFNSKLELSIRAAKTEDILRVQQLLNRTNELNVTVKKRTLDELYDMLSEKYLFFVAELKDRYGDYGLIGTIIIKQTSETTYNIINLTVSCRAMGRGIGSALLVFIIKYLEEKNAVIIGYVKQTRENWRILPLYEKRGFKKFKSVDDTLFFKFDFTEKTPDYPPWLSITKF